MGGGGCYERPARVKTRDHCVKSGMKTFSLCVISDEQSILKNEKQYAEGKQLNKGGGGGGDKRLVRVKTRDQHGRHDMETCSLLFASLL